MLVEKYGAVAADWESGSIAWVCERNGVKCLILRGVSDLVSEVGGEAYGDYGLFVKKTREVMKGLVEGVGRLVRVVDDICYCEEVKSDSALTANQTYMRAHEPCGFLT